MIAIPLVAFVIGPEVSVLRSSQFVCHTLYTQLCFRLALFQYFATKHGETDPRKRMSDPEARVAGNLFTFWEFEGYLKYSPMFYG